MADELVLITPSVIAMWRRAVAKAKRSQDAQDDGYQQGFGDALAELRSRSGRQWWSTMIRVHDAALTLVSQHEDCDDCAARADWTEEPHDEVCRAHGAEGSALVHALMEMRDLFGPCSCGHAHKDHRSVDFTSCCECECAAFALRGEA